MALSSGQILQNRYRITALLDQSEWSNAYLGDDLRLPGQVVTIREYPYISPEAREELFEKAHILVMLDHPSLPRVFEHFFTPDQAQYLVMDYVEGETLEDVVERHGPLPEPKVVALTEQLLGALEYLHRNSVIHGDVQPANIKITPDGKAVLMDFGTAMFQAVGRPTKIPSHTPGFTPIEKYDGEVDARTDLYSLGAVMYFMLTGQVPPEATDLAAGMSHLIPPRQLRPALSASLQEVILKAMALSPAERYQTAREMAGALLAQARVTPKPRAVISVPLPRPKSLLVFLILAVGIMLLLKFGLLWDALSTIWDNLDILPSVILIIIVVIVAIKGLVLLISWLRDLRMKIIQVLAIAVLVLGGIIEFWLLLGRGQWNFWDALIVSLVTLLAIGLVVSLAAWLAELVRTGEVGCAALIAALVAITGIVVGATLLPHSARYFLETSLRLTPTSTPLLTPTPIRTPYIAYTLVPFGPTRTPQTIPVEIAALYVSSKVQEDGTVKNTAQLSIAPLGIGDLQLTAPARIRLGQSGVVRLVITPDTALTSLPQVALASLSIDSPGLAGEPDYVLRLSDRIQIYPVMVAELRGPNFDIVSDDQPAKSVVSSLPVEWMWLVTPEVGGEQILVLYISIPVLIDQTRETISAQPLKNIPIQILVEVTPTPTPSQTPSPTFTPTPTPTSTPTPTPTPLPIARQIGDQLVNNSASILGALITLSGVLAGVYASIQNSRREADIKSLEMQIQITKSKEERETLKREIARLRSIRWWQFWRR